MCTSNHPHDPSPLPPPDPAGSALLLVVRRLWALALARDGFDLPPWMPSVDALLEERLHLDSDIAGAWRRSPDATRRLLRDHPDRSSLTAALGRDTDAATVDAAMRATAPLVEAVRADTLATALAIAVCIHAGLERARAAYGGGAGAADTSAPLAAAIHRAATAVSQQLFMPVDDVPAMQLPTLRTALQERLDAGGLDAAMLERSLTSLSPLNRGLADQLGPAFSAVACEGLARMVESALSVELAVQALVLLTAAADDEGQEDLAPADQDGSATAAAYDLARRACAPVVEVLADRSSEDLSRTLGGFLAAVGARNLAESKSMLQESVLADDDLRRAREAAVAHVRIHRAAALAGATVLGVRTMELEPLFKQVGRSGGASLRDDRLSLVLDKVARECRTPGSQLARFVDQTLVAAASELWSAMREGPARYTFLDQLEEAARVSHQVVGSRDTLYRVLQSAGIREAAEALTDRATGYLFGIARNAAIDVGRARSRDLETPSLDAPPEKAADGAALGTRIAARETSVPDLDTWGPSEKASLSVELGEWLRQRHATAFYYFARLTEGADPEVLIAERQRLRRETAQQARQNFQQELSRSRSACRRFQRLWLGAQEALPVVRLQLDVGQPVGVEALDALHAAALHGVPSARHQLLEVLDMRAPLDERISPELAQWILLTVCESTPTEDGESWTFVPAVAAAEQMADELLTRRTPAAAATVLDLADRVRKYDRRLSLRKELVDRAKSLATPAPLSSFGVDTGAVRIIVAPEYRPDHLSHVCSWLAESWPTAELRVVTDWSSDTIPGTAGALAAAVTDRTWHRTSGSARLVVCGIRVCQGTEGIIISFGRWLDWQGVLSRHGGVQVEWCGAKGSAALRRRLALLLSSSGGSS